MPSEANPSTQLRAIEGEIAELENAPSSIRQFRKSKLCDEAITISKELEKDVISIDYSCEQLGERVEQLTIENQDLRTENATLKRRLDEAMKGLRFFADWDNWKRNGLCDPNSGNFDAVTYAQTRITEIDKL